MGQSRTVEDLLAGANRKRQEREQRESRERERRQQAQAAARAAYIDTLAGQEDEVWGQVETLVRNMGPSFLGLPGFGSYIRTLAVNSGLPDKARLM